MQFSYRRLKQPEAGLRSQNSTFKLRFWLQIRLQRPKTFESGPHLFGPLKTENHWLICTYVLLHQQRWWLVAKWYIGCIVGHVQENWEALIYIQTSMGIGRIFFRGEIVDFSRWWPKALFKGWDNSNFILPTRH